VNRGSIVDGIGLHNVLVSLTLVRTTSFRIGLARSGC